MAKLVVEIDTKEKTSSVSINGETLDNVSYVSVYGGTEPGFSVETAVKDGDVYKMQVCRAFEDGDKVEKVEIGGEEIERVRVKETLSQSIAKLIGMN